MSHTLDVEDWIELSNFYLFDCEPNEAAEKGLKCVALLCENAPASKMLIDLVKFCSMAFYDNAHIHHRLNLILENEQVHTVVSSMKHNYKRAIAIANRLKKRLTGPHILSRLQDEYLSYGLFYNLAYCSSSDVMDTHTFKQLLSWHSLHCRLVYPIWNYCFSNFIKNYGVEYSTMLTDELIDVPVTLLTVFLSILSNYKQCNAPISGAPKVIGTAVDVFDQTITLSLYELHTSSFRAILLFLCLCSFCIDLSTFQVVLREPARYSEWEVLNLFKTLHSKFREDEQFYDLLSNHVANNLCTHCK
ncbi:hypothetical protein P9112_010647 [Eukaryota sp. TZLM1-RC]